MSEDNARHRKDNDPTGAAFFIILLAPFIGATVFSVGAAIGELAKATKGTLPLISLIKDLVALPFLVIAFGGLGYIFTLIPSIVTGLIAYSIISKRGQISIVETFLLGLLAILVFALQMGMMGCWPFLSAPLLAAKCGAGLLASLTRVVGLAASTTLVTAFIVRWLLLRWKFMSSRDST